jgi:putative transposase
MTTEPQASHRGWHWRGYLPHFDGGALVQAVTFRLADALPAGVVEALRSELGEDSAPEMRQRIAALLDAGHGSCLLREPWAATLVEETLAHFDGIRYRLVAWVIMPNHVHVILECHSGYSLGAIVRSWKSYSARRINARRGGTGRLWYPDYFDRYIRDAQHLAYAVEYVHLKPVRAGLTGKAEEWPYSSAARGRRE